MLKIRHFQKSINGKVVIKVMCWLGLKSISKINKGGTTNRDPGVPYMMGGISDTDLEV